MHNSSEININGLTLRLPRQQKGHDIVYHLTVLTFYTPVWGMGCAMIPTSTANNKQHSNQSGKPVYDMIWIQDL
jgi:hypothetical protein